jgi:thiol-disulfide isomerase/thioredoxin
MNVASLLLVLITTLPSSAGAAEPVLLDFHSRSCPPCRQMRPVVEMLARRGYPIKSIDVEKAPDLAAKYEVQAVPTFIVIDASGQELDRTSGSQPAPQLARFYLNAKAKAQPPANSRAHADEDDDPDGHDPQDEADRVSARADQDAAAPPARPRRDEEPGEEPAFTNPRPWETVVRIRILSQGAVGFGSGTIISSSPQESLILTCAHIFKLDGPRQAPPDRFPRQIMVDLFDGKLHGERPAQVHFVESVEGRAIDYDFNLDVGLIRIRPGRRLPAARVVPAHWEPRPRMKMLTVGCSEGQDATAWHTLIVNPRMRGLSGNDAYQAIECMIAPKQGRSGGGLFTTDGYVGGVCNFAEPRGDHGLYATPRSIYRILDRNRLMALYEPVTRGSATLATDEGRRPRRRDGAPITVARGQSPDRDEKEADRGRVRPGDVTVPDPEIVGIKPPVTALRTPGGGPAATRRTAWHPTHPSPAPAAPRPAEPIGKAEPTDLNLDPAADHDRFSHFEDDEPAPKQAINPEDLPSSEHPDPGPSSAPAAKSRWRPARPAEGQPITGIAGG